MKREKTENIKKQIEEIEDYISDEIGKNGEFIDAWGRVWTPCKEEISPDKGGKVNTITVKVEVPEGTLCNSCTFFDYEFLNCILFGEDISQKWRGGQPAGEYLKCQECLDKEDHPVTPYDQMK